MYNSTKVTLLSVHAYTCILIGVGEGGMSPISPQDYNSACVNLPPSLPPSLPPQKQLYFIISLHVLCDLESSILIH